MSYLETCGLGRSSGSSSITRSIRVRTSLAASSTSVPHTNFALTRLDPSPEVLVSSSTPATTEMDSSMYSVTSRSISSGLAVP